MSALAVEAEKVGFGCGDLRFLRDITLTFYEGETVALLGPPGCGKTLLAQMLCGLQAPTSGRLLVCGHPVGASSDAVRRLSSAAFGSSGVDRMLTVMENTRLHAKLHDLCPNEEKPLTARLLRTFGLSDRRDVLCARLTPGELARLAVVCAMLSAPKVLVVDDLLQWMDAESRKAFREITAEMRARYQTTVVLTSRNPDEVDFCDRIAVLSRGKLLALDTPNMLRDIAGCDELLVKPVDDRSAGKIRRRFGVIVEQDEDGALRIAVRREQNGLEQVLRDVLTDASAVYIRRPSLHDAYAKLLAESETSS